MLLHHLHHQPLKPSYNRANDAYNKAANLGVQDVRLGSPWNVVTWNTSGSWPKREGWVIVNLYKDWRDYQYDGHRSAPIQKKVNNNWYTVSGGYY